MLFARDHEDEGLHTGLNVFGGDVIRFPDVTGLKVPHMGWNTLRFASPACPLFAGLPADPAVYFVHSYFPQPVAPRHRRPQKPTTPRPSTRRGVEGQCVRDAIPPRKEPAASAFKCSATSPASDRLKTRFKPQINAERDADQTDNKSSIQHSCFV